MNVTSDYRVTTAIADSAVAIAESEKIIAMMTAIQSAEDAGLPRLTGSIKQQAWSVSLRDTALADVDERGSPAIRASLLEHTGAKWWIDARLHLSAIVTALIVEG
jgi:hypothetical protein